MRGLREGIEKENAAALGAHRRRFGALAEDLAARGVDIERVLQRLDPVRVAVPSWALGTGGTRFGRFPGPGEPATLEQKLEDAGLLKALCQATDSISIHIPWDIPADHGALRAKAEELGLRFDAVNSNTFQDQKGQALSYKFGSLCHTDRAVRAQAVAHNLEVIEHGRKLGSRALTVWLADGSNYPGQSHFRRAFERTLDCLREIHAALPGDWRMFTEHKPFEPNFYSSVNADWGSSLLLAEGAGPRCQCLVDLGHHLQGVNIEQVVSRLAMRGRLGGFHFNDSKYSDDDLTVGCLRPYTLFLVCNELVDLEGGRQPGAPFPQGEAPAYMVDASHNTKDPLEDLLQSFEAIRLAYAQALLVDRPALEAAQQANDAAGAQEILQAAFRADLRPALAELRLRQGGALEPMRAFRSLRVRERLASERGRDSRSSGL